MPLDAVLGAIVGLSAAGGALVLSMLQTIWRWISGIHVSYEPI
jgi:hypothetical protein